MKRLLFCLVLAGVFLVPVQSVAAVGPACTTVCYADAVNGNDGNGGATPADAKQTIQAAIDAVNAGGDVRVLPGTYSETASNRTVVNLGGTYTFGLFFSTAQGAITLQGVTAADVAITDPTQVAARINTYATNNFGTSGIFVEGDGVTIAGVEIGTNPNPSKTIEVIGDAFTLRDSYVNDGGYSIYLDDFRFDEGTDTSHVQSYTIDNNRFADGMSIDITSGAGYSGPVSGRQITNNVFADNTQGSWAFISFSGADTGVPWFVYSVGGAEISGNTFGSADLAIRARGTYDNSQFDWESYWNDNTFERAVVVGASVPGQPRTYSYPNSYGTFNDVRQIGGLIQVEVDHGIDGDTVLVNEGAYTEQVVLSADLHLLGEDGRADTFIQAPATIPVASNPDSAIVKVSGATTEAEIDGFTIAGPGPSGCGSIGFGIFVRDGAYANIHDNALLDIRDAPISGCQNGVAIQVGRSAIPTSGTADIVDNIISGYQKNGITISNFGSDATISGNTVTGAGPVAFIAQNGVQVSSGATAEISDNTISCHSYTPFTVVSTGILPFAASSIDVHDNDLSENQIGIYVLDTPGSFDSNLVDATAAGTGSAGFWGIVVDAPPPTRQPSPSDGEISAGALDVLPMVGPAARVLAIQTVTLTNNEFTSDGSTGGIGVEVDGGYGAMDIDVTFNNNHVHGWEYGVAITQCSSSCSGTTVTGADFTLNSISGNDTGLDATATTVPVDATSSWWGAVDGPAPGGSGDPVTGSSVDSDPWLCDGTDLQPGVRGFQPASLANCGGDAPDTTIDSSPAAQTSATPVSFTFHGTSISPESSLTYECQMDALGWQPCTSPATYSGLSTGSHTFEVRAVDPVGNVDPTPASYTWSVDASPPNTTIHSKPHGMTTQTSATFTFSGQDSGSGIDGFECKLDQGDWSDCTSPKSYTSLSTTTHTFQVRAVDGAGNLDPSPATFTWTVDASPPDTTITSTPANPSNSSSASFAFSGSDTGSGIDKFECKLDSGSWSTCSSQKSYSNLGNGNHTFQVRAKDKAGNTDPTPAHYTWKVDRTAPQTTITSKPSNGSATIVTFRFSGSDTGSGLAGFECKLDSGAWQSCTSPQGYERLSTGSHTFRVRATDKAGNVDSSPASWTWTVGRRR